MKIAVTKDMPVFSASTQNKHSLSLVTNTNAPLTKSEKACDELLTCLAQQGDKRAFDKLMLKHQSGMVRAVGQYVKDREMIADIVQESFLRAYRALDRFRRDSQFSTWLYRIAVNTALNHLSQQSKRQMVSVQLPEDDIWQLDQVDRNTFGPELEMVAQQTRVRLSKEFGRLPLDLRTALGLREFDGLSYERISELMHCPVGTVRSRIARARHRLESAGIVSFSFA